MLWFIIGLVVGGVVATIILCAAQLCNEHKYKNK